MSKRAKTANVFHGFTFGCSFCDSDTPLVKIIDSSVDDHPPCEPECQICHHHYDDQEIDLGHHIGMMIPCNIIFCPYCQKLNLLEGDPKVIESERVDVHEFSIQENPIGSFLQERLDWELPSLIVCEECHKPIRLAASKRMILLRLRDPIIYPTLKTSKPFVIPDFNLTPKMSSF